MVNRKVRGLVVCGVVAMLLATPAKSEACGFLDGLFGWCGTARTTYMAPYAAPVAAPAVCNPCAAQTCCYMPQTCYRTVYQRVPVTTCQAATYCNFWTGCPVTTYRPVTTWTYRARLVPYTTYRLVYSNPCVPCVSYGACDPCAGICTPATTIPSACGPAGCGAVSTPVVPYSGPSGSTTAPSGSTVPKTYQENSQPAEGGGLKPIPSTNLNSTPVPKLIDPDNRTASRQLLQATHYRLISSPAKVVSSSGWRASSD